MPTPPFHTFYLLGALAALAACGGPASPGPAPRLSAARVAAATACESFIASLPEGYFHDFVSVPENADDPTGPTIRVFYYGRKIEGATPVLFLEGGPADDSHLGYRTLTRLQGRFPEFDRIPFVFMDQRGTGCSDPYPQGGTPPVLRRLAHYGSTGIVRDAEAIRARLIGTRPWKILGQSYGAYIAHRYVVMAPAALISASAHGEAILNDPLLRYANRIAAQHQVVNDYLARYPEDAAALNVLRDRLGADRCFHPAAAPVGERRCGKWILEPFYGEIGFLDDWDWIHLWLGLMVTRGELDPDGLQSFVDQNYGLPAPGRSSAWALRVIKHVEGFMALGSTDDCRAAVKLLQARRLDPSTWPLHECQPDLEDPYSSADVVEALRPLPMDTLDLDAFREALAGHPDLRFYLYSGDKDPYVPQANFAPELRAVGSRVRYTHFASTGHDGFYEEPLVWRNLLIE